MRIALIAGGVGLAVCVLGALIDPAHFLRSWLVAFALVLALSLGSLVIVMINYVTGGNWGFVTRRFLEAASRTLPLVALLFVPLLLGLWNEPYLYEWASPEAHHDKIIANKAPYLNVTFFLIRAAIYFAIWNGLAFVLNHLSRRQDVEKKPGLAGWCGRVSAPGIVLYALTITFASIDWVMSLEPHWYSTIFMAAFGMGQVLTAFTFAVAMLLLLTLLQKPHDPVQYGIPVTPPNPEGIQPAGGPVMTHAAHAPISHPSPPSSVPTMPMQTMSDLGTLMMGFIMVWAYLSICQFLLIYSGNLPVEITYYNKRGVGPDSESAWTYVAMALIALHFFLPFFLLLNNSVKRNPRRLVAVAFWVLFMRVVEMLWLIVPAFEHPGSNPLLGALLYPAALVGVGGLWFAFYLWQIRQLPLTPQYNPEEVAAHGQAAH